MRYIKKSETPHCLVRFYADTEKIDPPINRGYSALQNPEKRELKQYLICEQYELCAYTGLRITHLNSHIEHVKPQDICKKELEKRGGAVGREWCDDTSYQNMVAARNCDGGRNGYGAVAREDNILPVTPLQEDCSQRFLYDFAGGVGASEEADEEAKSTILLLNLKHKELTNARRGKIDAYLDVTNEDLWVPEYLENLIRTIDQPNDGRLEEFSFVLKSIAENVLKSISE